MISAREFCREPHFPLTLFFSYSFDPLFFERIPLTDLDKGGSRRILVLADGSQVRDAMRACVGQLAYLGRRYVLAETVRSNTFHPKLIIRLSSTKGRLWLGSGNLTQAGWGGNQEIAAAWNIGPQASDKGEWLPNLLDRLAEATSSSAYASELEKVYDMAPWLLNDTEPSTSPFLLLGSPDRPLGPQLAERWRGRRFEEVRLCTGSTDANGAFLLWLYRTFGVKRAIVCLNPAFASFDKDRLTKLPLDIRFVKPKDDVRMHAKFYWFTGPDGNAALMGSANCSAAAWIVGNRHGNFEAVVPYDAPTKEEFKSILSIFDGKKLPPETMLTTMPSVAESEGGDLNPYRLVSVRLRSMGRVVEAMLEPLPPKGSDVELIVQTGGKTIEFALSRRGDLFVAPFPANHEIGLGTAFASATVHDTEGAWTTDAHWIDNEAALARAMAEGLSDPSLRDLSRHVVMSADRQQILEAIHSVSAKLLRGEAIVSSAVRAGRRAAEARETRPEDELVSLEAIDPAETLRSLAELSAANSMKSNGFFVSSGGSLAGVMAMLFSRETMHVDEDIDLSQEAWTGDNPEPASEESDDVQGDIGDDATRRLTVESSAETQAHFQAELNSFLNEIERATFANTCTATTMVQALAFPLLVCVRVHERGWLPAKTLVNIALRIVEVMFNRSYGKGKPAGLFKNVQHRYNTLGLSADFLRAVGDGALWSALLAALAGDAEDAPRRFIPQAQALVAVSECKELLAVATPSNLEALARASIIPSAEQAATGRIVAVRNTLARVTDRLKGKEEALFASLSRSSLQNAGSLMWSSKWGWLVVSSQQAQTYCSGYINVDVIAKNDADMRASIAAVLDAFNGPPSTPGQAAIDGVDSQQPATDSVVG